MSINQHIRELQSTETELSREISLFGGVSILVGIMVGSGIFYLGSYVFMFAGNSQGLALLAWVVGGIVTLISGLCYAELGAMMPRAGGSYVYLREAYGKSVAFMSGFSSFILGSSGSIAALALAFATILSNFVAINEATQKGIAILVIVVLTIANYYGVKFGSWIQNLFTVAKLVPILIILGLGLFLGNQSPDLSINVDASVDVMGLISMVAMGVVATLWAYEGWTNLNNVSEELKNPKRNLPLALVIAIFFVMILYVLFNFAIYRVLSFQEIVDAIAGGNLFLGTTVANRLLGGFGSTLVGLGMLISVFGATNGCVMVFPRLYYAMAKDGLFFRRVGEINPSTKTPANAIILSAVVSIILVFFRNLNQLTSLVVLQGLIFNGLIFFSVIIFRRTLPTIERPYRVWGYPIVPILATLVMVGLLVNTLMTSDFNNSLLSLLIPAAAYLIYRFIPKNQLG
ncbi:MAG TPA: amino acid permease [Erysipelotrichaceae bacterium]|nr:MAG: amino acid permease [Candidatus Edwardsbacteria bacterium GWE2_54_12]HAM62437.1 amino acid permease [Erysipelotrichaceae bacterium]HBZ40980.1 amino acid permease [Erysipelotrichaceae bacterium]